MDFINVYVEPFRLGEEGEPVVGAGICLSWKHACNIHMYSSYGPRQGESPLKPSGRNKGREMGAALRPHFAYPALVYQRTT